MSDKLRNPTQKLVAVPMNQKLIEKMDDALAKVGYSSRSSFIRDAIAEKLNAIGIEIPIALSIPPSRTGKGGRPRHTEKKEVLAPKKRTTAQRR